MDEIKELTSKINDYQLNYRKAMLHQIEKIVFKNK